MANTVGKPVGGILDSLIGGATPGIQKGLEYLLQDKIHTMAEGRKQAAAQQEQQRYTNTLKAAGLPAYIAELMPKMRPQESAALWQSGALNQLMGQPQDAAQDQASPLEQITNSLEGGIPDGQQAPTLPGQQVPLPQAGEAEGAAPFNLPEAMQAGYSRTPMLKQQAEQFAEQMKYKQEQAAQKLTTEQEKARKETYRDVGKELKEASKTIQNSNRKIKSAKQLLAISKNPKAWVGRSKALIDDLKLGRYLTSAETQLGEKTSARMLMDEIETVKTGGGKLTDKIMEAYGKSLPSLVNTKEGIELISANVVNAENVNKAIAKEEEKTVEKYDTAKKDLPINWKVIARKNAKGRIKASERQLAETVGKYIYRNFYDENVKFKNMIKSGKLKDGAIIPNSEGGYYILKGKSLVLREEGD